MAMNAERVRVADLRLAILGLGYVGLPLALPWYIGKVDVR